MCLAVAGKIVERNGNEGAADVRGNQVRVRLDVVPEAAVGDYVLVHAGFAITVISEEDAVATDRAFEEFDDAKRAAEQDN
jgi:hydrogenase expression/formation protein HypC